MGYTYLLILKDNYFYAPKFTIFIIYGNSMKKNKPHFRISLLLLWGLAACTSPRNETITTADSLKKKHGDSLTADTSTIFQDTARVADTFIDTSQRNDLLHADPAARDSNFVELIQLDSTFILDLRYATADNFLKEKVYDCAECLLRATVAQALIHAHENLKKKGYRIKLFDCYRPLDVQKKMWKIMPDDRFVGNPYGNGSKHNKGVAVDLTLTDLQGKEQDMGTPFDFFGREAYHAYTKLPADVLERRRLLKQAMMEAGFHPITSEWWHYSYNKKSYPVSNYTPTCL